MIFFPLFYSNNIFIHKFTNTKLIRLKKQVGQSLSQRVGGGGGAKAIRDIFRVGIYINGRITETIFTKMKDLGKLFKPLKVSCPCVYIIVFHSKTGKKTSQIVGPPKTPQYHSSVKIRGVINWSPMIPRDASLSDSCSVHVWPLLFFFPVGLLIKLGAQFWPSILAILYECLHNYSVCWCCTTTRRALRASICIRVCI